MSYIGARQRFTATIPTAGAAEVARIKNCLGAIAILVKVYGGSTAGAVTPTAVALDAGGTISPGSQGVALAVDKPTTMLSNRVSPQADYCTLRYAPPAASSLALPIPTPEVALIGVIATADSVGAVIDCWAVFADSQNFSIVALPD